MGVSGSLRLFSDGSVTRVNVFATPTLHKLAERRMRVSPVQEGGSKPRDRFPRPLDGLQKSTTQRSFVLRGVEKNASVDMPAQAIPAPSLGAIKVLHIEDDLSVARSIARALRARGCEVASAATRDEAMQHLEVHGFRPDVILTDYQLEMGVTGDVIVAEIAARLQFRPPTIMLTGVASQQVAGVKSFADRTLAKPVDINALLCEIESLLRDRQ
jgi:CheY-like chemotaxis protein